ncbi:MAG: hypothetical protein ACR2JE_05425 [Acidobacteriaceae bacterium]
MSEPSFLAYIARQYRRQKEDVGTDILAYLLNKQPVQDALGQLLSDLGYPYFPPHFSVQTPRSRGAHGTPDLEIIDDQKVCCAIIENKFWAGLTRKQPIEYLRQIRSAGGLLLFIVPDERREYIWKILRARCSEAKRSIVPGRGGSLIGLTKDRYIAVSSWTNLLWYLNKCSPNNAEISVFVTELRRLCAVAPEDKIQPLDDSEVGDKTIGSRVVNYAALASEIAKRDIKDFVKDKKQKYECGPGWSGTWGELGRFHVWIGFEANAWSKHGISPIWMSFEETSQINQMRPILRSQTEVQWFEEERERNGPILSIPVSIKPRVGHDDLIDGAIDSIRRVAMMLRSVPE